MAVAVLDGDPGDPDGLRARIDEALDGLAAAGAGPLAVVAEGEVVDAAVRALAAVGRARALVLLSAVVGEGARTLIGEWPELAVLGVVDSLDRDRVGDTVAAYLASGHAHSDLHVGEGVGSGSAMFGSWSATPDAPALDALVETWLATALAPWVEAEPVSFQTVDGWRISGDLLLPAPGPAPGPPPGPAPGVVLLHSGRSDRDIFSRLSRLLVAAGFAVLNVDWRGRGRSTNLGTYFELTSEQRAAAGHDARAAIDHLASRPEVDGARIGLVGVVHGAEYAVRGSIGDERVRGLVLLTGYRPADEAESEYLTSGVEVLYVSSAAHRPITEAMRELYDRSPGRRTRMIVVPGGAIGYQLFELQPWLEPAIVSWLDEVVR